MTSILPAKVRTRVVVPLTFPDGYATTAEVFTFEGLADNREHLALGWATGVVLWTGARRWCVRTASA